VLCGTANFIKKARKIRKHLGGGMRQAGILAAAGIVALETMVHRLADDHVRAKHLAEGLSKTPGIVLDPGSPATNMIFFSLADSVILTTAQIEEQMKARGLLVNASGPRRFRLVTHVWIGDGDVEKVVTAFREVLQ
jgi:threonine aldolase